MPEFKIGNLNVGGSHPAIFIAEIGSNHDGNLNRAFKLIELAKQAGASIAKFQHYKADTLASAVGFERLSLAHYTDNPYDVFKKYEISWEWTPLLKEHCDKVGIEFMSTPYSLEAVDHLNPYVSAFKIGSGDITYHRLLSKAILTKKPVMLSTGASNMEEVKTVVKFFDDYPFVLMHCNTNYEDSPSNDQYLNLRIINRYKNVFGYMAVIGYSSHTNSSSEIIATILSAKVIEAHFTDGCSNSPDDTFALLPNAFRETVEATRHIETMLGDGTKRVEENEKDTVVLQRRCLRAAVDLSAGTILGPEHVVALRPAPEGSLDPFRLNEVVGKTIRMPFVKGQAFYPGLLFPDLEG